MQYSCTCKFKCYWKKVDETMCSSVLDSLWCGSSNLYLTCIVSSNLVEFTSMSRFSSTIQSALLQDVPTNYMSMCKLLTLLRVSSVGKWRIRLCEEDCVVHLRRRYLFRPVGLNKITKIMS